MIQGILYRYFPSRRSTNGISLTGKGENFKRDLPMVSHFHEKGTLNRTYERYFWTEMSLYIADNMKSSAECNK